MSERRQFRDGVVPTQETRYDDVDWLTLMMIYSGTGSFFNLNDKVRDAASSLNFKVTWSS